MAVRPAALLLGRLQSEWLRFFSSSLFLWRLARSPGSGRRPRRSRRAIFGSPTPRWGKAIRHARARTATRGKRTDLEKARAIYDDVTSSMKYDKSGTGWGRGDAIYACDVGRGNCTDFHSLLIGMARSVGIPGRFSIGFPLPEQRGKGDISGYHCWAEMYVDGAWLPVDSSEAA